MNIAELKKAVSGTKEWADKNINFLDGCSHDCKYCYAKAMAIRFRRMSPNDWPNEKVRIADLKRKIVKCKMRYMFPSSHDITPKHLKECLFILHKTLAFGDEVLIVSKPHYVCIKAICGDFQAYRNKILFQFTIGSADSDILKFWEPNAPDFDERLKCLKHAVNYGYETSVSCEPMLDDNVEDVIRVVRPHVTDSIWLGKPNRLLGILTLNGFKEDQETMIRAMQLLESLSDDYIRELHAKYKNDPLIKWKDSIKKVVRIKRQSEAGLDI